MIQAQFKQYSIIVATLIAVCLQCMLTVWADVSISQHELASKVKDYIQQSTPIDDPGAKLNVEVLNCPVEPITLHGDQVQWLIEDSRPTPLTPRTIVQVTLTTEEDTRHIGLPVRLLVERSVWVAKKFIPAKQVISKADVTIQRKRLEFNAPYAVGSQEDITNYTSRTNITPGTVIDNRQLTLTPAIYRNDDVHMILSLNNGIQVSVLARALEDGAIGKKIRVRQESSNNQRVYTGEVINRNTVMVRM